MKNIKVAGQLVAPTARPRLKLIEEWQKKKARWIQLKRLKTCRHHGLRSDATPGVVVGWQGGACGRCAQPDRSPAGCK